MFLNQKDFLVNVINNQRKVLGKEHNTKKFQLQSNNKLSSIYNKSVQKPFDCIIQTTQISSQKLKFQKNLTDINNKFENNLEIKSDVQGCFDKDDSKKSAKNIKIRNIIYKQVQKQRIICPDMKIITNNVKKIWISFINTNQIQFFKALKRIPIQKNIVVQIKQDVDRTFRNSVIEQYFNEQKSQKFMNLQNILCCYAKLDKEISYIQGLNMLAGCILIYLKDQFLTFQFLRYLMIEKKIRKFYINNFKNIQQSSIIVFQQYLKPASPELYHFIKSHQISLIAFMLPWFLTLFSNIMQIQYTHLLINKFIEQGIDFFYRFITQYMIYLKNDIFEAGQNFIIVFGSNYNRKININWSQILRLSDKKYKYIKQIDG